MPGSALDREAYLRSSATFPIGSFRCSPSASERAAHSRRDQQGTLAAAADRGGQPQHNHLPPRIPARRQACYEQAQAAIDGKPDDKTGTILETILKPLWAAYQTMAKARDRRGPLDLDLPERKIMLDKNGMVADIRVPERLEAHRLIEEMMIAANVAAAETLEKHHSPLIYRVHDSPSPEKLMALREFLGSLDIPFNKADAVKLADFNRTLLKARAEGKIDQVSEMVLRSQAQAEYSPATTGILASTSTATRTSPRRSAATPT